MQTHATIYWRDFIIHEFQVLSDNPMPHEHIVNKHNRNECPAGRPENTCDIVTDSNQAKYIRSIVGRVDWGL